jgi:hypothetical protein
VAIEGLFDVNVPTKKISRADLAVTFCSSPSGYAQTSISRQLTHIKDISLPLGDDEAQSQFMQAHGRSHG